MNKNKTPTIKNIIFIRRIFISIVVLFIIYTIISNLDFYWKAAISFVSLCLVINLFMNNIKDQDLLKMREDLKKFDESMR